jgi:Zn-dependent protease
MTAAFVADPRARRYTAAMASAETGAVIVRIAIVALPVLFSIVLHEVAHGAVAYALGDPTAHRLGRLTLNPLPHIDPVGTVLVPGALLLTAHLFGGSPFVFGWARPVPVDFRRLRRPRRDTLLVALAGPGTNLALAAVSAVALGWLAGGPEPGLVRGAFAAMAWTSLGINCALAVFNLLPVPPLDGGRVLAALLPARAAGAMRAFERVGVLVVLLVAINTGIVPRLVRPLVHLFLGLAR